MKFLTAAQREIVESTKIIDTEPFYSEGLWNSDTLISTENGVIESMIDILLGKKGGIPVLTQKHNDHIFSLLEGAISRREEHLEVALKRLRIKTTKNGKGKI